TAEIAASAANQVRTGFADISASAALLGPSFDIAGGKAQLFQKVFQNLRDNNVSTADALAKTAQLIGESFQDIQIDQEADKATKSLDALANKAALLGPAFNEAGSKVQVFEDLVASLEAKGVPPAEALARAVKVVGDTFENLQ